jgi:RimJ/RimL family protein N-acetyltransferase
MSRQTKDQVLATFEALKSIPASKPWSLSVRHNGRMAANLEPVTWQDSNQPGSIVLLANWWRAAADNFPAQMPMTLPGAQRWLIKGVLEAADRLLFWLRTVEGTRIGHVGLSRFDANDGTIELDNVVRGLPGLLPGIVSESVRTLLNWTFNQLPISSVYVRAFSDNECALRLGSRCGFRETMRVPLRREQEGDFVRWLEVGGQYRQPVTRYLVTMGLSKDHWLACQSHARAA